ncbi:MAG: hypothetical protein ACFCUM_17835 [Bacteroidales bacterium]
MGSIIKYIEADVFAEFKSAILISQSADSSDLEDLNRDIIESVKFRFIEKEILGKRSYPEVKENMADLKKLKEHDRGYGLFLSEEELLDDILKNKVYRHGKHLRFLASKHQRSRMKLRFVLSPFSFVFLLRGKDQNHIIMETLDTEEATYIWHTGKNQAALSRSIRDIEKALNVIRKNGKEAFLQQQPENFSRIFHDYTDERKGFFLWKDNLEEKLV